MRTTIAIDDDVLSAAKSLAQRHNKSVGEVISTLARQGLLRDAPTTRDRDGVPLLHNRGDAAPVTMELVNQLRDELP